MLNRVLKSFFRLGRDNSSKNALQIRLDDVFLVAYPKSGITWLRFMIGNYLSNGCCDFANAHLMVPDLHMDAQAAASLASPRFLKTHEPYTPGYPRVVYLVRNGHDVAVSYYYYQLRMRMIEADTTFESFMDRYNAGKADTYGLWTDHVNGWIEQRSEQFLLLSYEQMRHDPIAKLTQVLRFAGLTPEASRVQQAVEASSLQQMKKLEQSQHRQIQSLVSVAFDREIPFVRSGKTGQGIEHYSPSMRDTFERVHGRAMQRIHDLTHLDTAKGGRRHAA